MKVLVADDEPVSRRLLESSLRRWGYDVIVAKTASRLRRYSFRPMRRNWPCWTG